MFKFTKQKNEKRQKQLIEQKENAYKELAEKQEKMEHTFCAIRGDSCTAKCIHFESGCVIYLEKCSFCDEHYSIIYPKCKLWK